MGNILREVTSQLGIDHEFISDKNKVLMNLFIFKSAKNASYYSRKDPEDTNFEFVSLFTNSRTSYYYSNYSDINIKDIYDAISNHNLVSFLKNSCKDYMKPISMEKSSLSSYIYKKRYYSEASILLGISNISFLQYYKNNKEDIDKKLNEIQEKLENDNSRWSRYDDMEKEIKNLFKPYTNYKKINEELDTKLNTDVERAVLDLIDFINTDEYFEDEFETSFINKIYSLLVDHLVYIDDKKILNKLFDAFHTASNRKNKIFFKEVYDKDIRGKKPFLLLSNHPKLMYYYLLFYKNNYKGRYMRNVLKHNILSVFLLSLKNINNTQLSLSRYMSKFEHIFNRYKHSKSYNLNTFLQIDTILTSDDTNLIIDILEQNMEILKILMTNEFKKRFYGRSNYLNYNMSSDVYFIERLIEKNLITKDFAKRFWTMITNFLLNYNISYSNKKKILTKLKNESIAGYDEYFASIAPEELQPIVCELYLS